MTFERKALRSVRQKMFRDYRKRLFKEAGAGRESHMLGAALVAVCEGFFVTADGNPQGF